MRRVLPKQCQKSGRALSHSLSIGCSVLIFCLAVSALTLPHSVSAAPDAVKQNQAELKKLRKRIQSLQSNLDKDKKKRSKLERELEKDEKKISSITSELNKLGTEIAKEEKAVERARQARMTRGRDLEKERDKLGAQMRAAYVMGQQEMTKLLLNQEDPQHIGRMLVYYQYLNRDRVQQIDALQARVKELLRLELTLKEHVSALAQSRNEQRSKLSQLESSRKKRRSTLAKLNKNISSAGSELGQLSKDERALQNLIDELQSAVSDIPIDLPKGKKFSKLKGKLPWPVKGRYLAQFGQKKTQGKLKWRGVWLAAPAGASVRVIADGRVAYVGWMHRYGLIVVVEHGEKYFSLYGHNETAKVKVGQWVEAGDVISTAGNTGGHSKTGAYLEIRKAKTPINPKTWLRPKS